MEDFSIEECKQACRRLTDTELPLSLPDGEVVEVIGKMIDEAAEVGDIEGTQKAIQLGNYIDEKRELSDYHHALLTYFKSVAYADVHRKAMTESKTATWNSNEAEDEIIAIRSALQAPGFEKLPDGRKCQIYTNLANTLRRYGRIPESIEYYDQALELKPRFAMARANRGIVLIRYSDQLYDPGHQGLFLAYAHADLATAISQESRILDQLKSRVQWWKQTLEGHLDERGVSLPELQISLYGHSKGKSTAEIAYREWCLENRLFVNPLNDLGAYSIASADPLTTPTMVLPVGEGPTYQGAYNQLKQEFVSSRYLLYDGLDSRKPHFSDRDVMLYDTPNKPVYSLDIEKVKISFREFYSITDKIEYLVSDYFETSRDSVNFRNVWVEKISKRGAVFDDEFVIERVGNSPLKGLFWLCKDIAPKAVNLGEEYVRSLEPDAQDLKELRDALEHRYVKVVDIDEDESLPDDRLAYVIRREDLYNKALKLAKLVRNAVVLLSLAIHHEEKERVKNRDHDRRAQQQLEVYDHDRKI